MTEPWQRGEADWQIRLRENLAQEATMNDPLHDPRFPNRPQHPDFWRLADVTTQLDGGTTEGRKTVEQVCEGLIDYESLTYSAEQRVGLFVQALGAKLPQPYIDMLETVYVTSVITGIEFQKRGGHRPA